MQVFLWLLLFALVVGGALVLAAWLRARRRNAELWGGQEPDQIAKWNEQTLGISEVRVHTDRPADVPAPASGAAVKATGTKASVSPEVSAPEAATRMPLTPEAVEALASGSPSSEASAPEPPAPPTSSGARALPPVPALTPSVLTRPASASHDSARPARSRPEWWEQDASGAGALLRSLVDVTGGSAAILQRSGEDYDVLAASGAASAVLHAHAGARTISARDARPLAELPERLATMVIGGHEAGLLPGIDADDVGETAVRALRSAPGSPCLVIDVSASDPLTTRAEGLIAPYADLMARVLDLPEDASAPEAALGDPLGSAMARIELEIHAAREQGRDLSLAVVVPHDAERLMEEAPDEVDDHVAALCQRLIEVSGTREVLPMGDLVVGALCEMKGPGAERWVRDLTREGEPVRIGIAVYGPRHVTPSLLRQDAISALHQTYTTDEACVIVE